MQIPLDYYRILGIPIPVTDEQLHQAYHDRSLQLPRREYSDFAIEARKQLLEEAYQVLCDPDQRAEYDSQFLAKSHAIIASMSENDHISPQTDQTEDLAESSLENNTPEIDIKAEQFIGGLLILQELGEYELVIDYGQTHLAQIWDNEENLTVKADLLLAIALAYLELSREQWHQQKYEKAATSAQKGLDILNSTDLFPHIVEEIRTDFYKLRPYRILERLALDLDQVKQRQKGLELLQTMLQERQGIDGKGNDYSGLGIDDFLRFIQQLRTYLTVDEQQNLFEAETKHNSAVTTYLNVYALIAQGFAQKQPFFIVKANEMLTRLSKHQDVQVEQAICALLLGQTELASLILEKSQNVATLEYIKEQSQGSPDLLPGLCRYGEHWLQTEVFSHFRDLAAKKVSLKDYFAVKSVQNYLETLSEESQEKQPSLADAPLENKAIISKTESEYPIPDKGELMMKEPAFSYSHTGKLELTRTSRGNTPTLSTRVKERKSEPTTRGNIIVNAYRQPDFEPTPRRRRRKSQVTVKSTNYSEQSPPSLPVLRQKTRPKPKKFLKIKRFLLSAIVLGGVTACALAVRESFSPLRALKGDQLSIHLDQPLLEIPSASAQGVLPGTLSQAVAEEIIQTWLLTKAEAFGSQHQVEQLKTILAEPMLSLWLNRANTLKGTSNYLEYQHQVQIQSVTNNIQNPNQGTIEASVKETAQYYQNGKLDPSRSYNDNLMVRYDLIRKGDQWLIVNIQVLK